MDIYVKVGVKRDEIITDKDSDFRRLRSEITKRLKSNLMHIV